ncbi:conserved hypothetical protein [Trichinella spiralis]|uniref:hypothetical protein n=1 Tax=Trichinella spiralis TaxID=6334 RepID=UPI0001EFD483|nr:conserved hypothetical protein [Trichinella spiralis]
MIQNCSSKFCKLEETRRAKPMLISIEMCVLYITTKTMKMCNFSLTTNNCLYIFVVGDVKVQQDKVLYKGRVSFFLYFLFAFSHNKETAFCVLCGRALARECANHDDRGPSAHHHNDYPRSRVLNPLPTT